MTPSVAVKVLEIFRLQTQAEKNEFIDTVGTHVRHIYDKLHVHSKSEAVAKAIFQKLV